MIFKNTFLFWKWPWKEIIFLIFRIVTLKLDLQKSSCLDMASIVFYLLGVFWVEFTVATDQITMYLYFSFINHNNHTQMLDQFEISKYSKNLSVSFNFFFKWNKFWRFKGLSIPEGISNLVPCSKKIVLNYYSELFHLCWG